MKKLTAIIAVAMTAAMTTTMSADANAATQTSKFLIFVDNGKQAGEQIVERDDDGLTRVRFIFKDNGRGPELTEQFRLGTDGTMTQYSVKGNSTFGAVVDESFEHQGELASSHSSSEKGQAKVNGSAMYVPMNSSFEFASATITALASRADGKLLLNDHVAAGSNEGALQRSMGYAAKRE